MRNLPWKFYLGVFGFLAILAAVPLVIGNMGCGSGGENTCSLEFSDSSTQEICDQQASAAGCDVPAQWSATTQFCSGVNCTVGCPDHVD